MPLPDAILIARNPTAGASPQKLLVRELQAGLEADGFQVDVTTDLEEMSSTAAQWWSEGRLRLVIAAGGDGTVAAVTERLQRQVPIAVFPLGTENLLAKWLKMTTDIAAFRQAVQAGRFRQIDAATANGKLAIITIGVGFDGEVVRQVALERRGNITKWNYAWPVIRTILTYGFPRLRVTAEQWYPLQVAHRGTSPGEVGGQANASEAAVAERPASSCSFSAPWLFVGNLPNYGGGLSILPFADPSDGFLDIATFRSGNRLSGLFYALRVAWRMHLDCRDFRAIRAKRLRVESARDVSYQVDGDYGGSLPLEIEVLPQRVRLLEPGLASARV